MQLDELTRGLSELNVNEAPFLKFTNERHAKFLQNNYKWLPMVLDNEFSSAMMNQLRRKYGK